MNVKQAVDVAALTAIVRGVLRDESAVIVDWEYQAIDYVAIIASTAGIERFAGTARTANGVVPWSVVRKVVVEPPGTTAGPAEMNYWKREPLVYASGLLDDLPGRLRAPRCHAVQQPADGVYWLWLEDLGEGPGEPWSRDRFRLAGQHFGVFNGTYVSARPLPPFEWLAQGPLRWHTMGMAPLPGLVHRDESWEHPAVRAVFPRAMQDRLIRQSSARPAIVAALERMPPTLTHFDANRANLFSRVAADGAEQTVVIDWDWLGIAALGEELNQLIFGPINRYIWPAADAPALEAAIFEGYLEGVREAGWRGDPRIVRFGYTASIAIRAAMGAVPGTVGLLLDRERLEQETKRWSLPAEQLLDQRVTMASFVLSRAEEALSLAQALA